MTRKSLRGVGVLLAILVFVAASGRADELIQNGGFDTAFGAGSDFVANSGPYGVWLVQPSNWVVSSDCGPTGVGDSCAQHLANTVQLVQGFQTAPHGGLQNATIDISWDYLYETGFLGSAQANVTVLGMNGTDHTGFFPPYVNDGTVLYSYDFPSRTNVYAHVADSFVVNGNFEALAVVITNGAFGSTGENSTSGLRYLDNVSMQTTAPVPEPASLLLLASGISTVLGRRRRKSRRKQETPCL